MFCLSGTAFIFYFLSFWFCKATIQEEEDQRGRQEISTNDREKLDHNDNDDAQFESIIWSTLQRPKHKHWTLKSNY